MEPVNTPAFDRVARTLATVFLDRDGVLNRKVPEGRYVDRWEDFHVLAGVPEAISRLNQAGLRVIVVSNQRGIALGLYSRKDVDELHAAFQSQLSTQGAHVDGFFVCPHLVGQCDCRKPLPGLFDQAVAAFPEVIAATSAMIGDSLVDIEFGRRLGMATILVEEETEFPSPGAAIARDCADFRFPTLAAAVDGLLGGS
jgi:D-glycero-D-manno-heptose 1,7-bisphosphate phosphatase